MEKLTRRDATKLAAAGVTGGVAGMAASPAPAQERKPDEGRPLSEALDSVMAEANAVFAKMGSVVEEEVRKGSKRLNIVEVARRAGLEIDERALDALQIDRIIHVHPWLPWHHWWPWRPLWCWWWHRYYSWYRCCPWWWVRCHWHL